MKKKLLSGGLILALLLYSFATAAEEGVVQKGSMKVTIPWNERTPLPKVKVDSSNVHTESNRADLTVRPPAAGSFGSAVGLPSRRILWTPAMKPGSLNRTRVLETVQTEDLSTLLFLEETGEPSGPFGTRIIAYDPANIRCFRVTELPFSARHLAPCGNTGEVLCVRYPQRELRDTLALMKVNLRTGKISNILPLKEELSGVWAGSDCILLRKKDGSFVQLISGKLRSVPIPADAGKVVFRKGILTAVTPRGIVSYDAAEEEKRPLVPLQGAEKVHPLADGSFYVLVKKENSNAYTLMLYSGKTKQFRTLFRGCGSDFYPSADGHGLFIRQKPGRENLLRLDTKKFTSSRTDCKPSDLSPRTSGTIEQMFPSPFGEELLCVPVIRRPFLIRYVKRQWKKILDE